MVNVFLSSFRFLLLSLVYYLKSKVYFDVSTGLLFRSVVKQAGAAAVGSGG